jgi:hypothetical protein
MAPRRKTPETWPKFLDWLQEHRETANYEHRLYGPVVGPDHAQFIELTVCIACGAVVHDTRVHTAWHENGGS